MKVILICLVYVGLIYAFVDCCKRFNDEYYNYRKQKPAKCSEGRPQGQGLEKAVFSVDDLLHSRSKVTMRCNIPVSADRCYDQSTERVEDCAQLPDKKTETRLVDSKSQSLTLTIELWQLQCIYETAKSFTTWLIMDHHTCTEEAWMCKTGPTTKKPCNIYEKAMRVCANLIKDDPFLGYQIGKDNIRETYTAFPWPWLVGTILTFLCVVLSCGCSLRVVKLEDQEVKLSRKVCRGLGDGAANVCIFAVLCCLFAWAGISLIDRAARPNGETQDQYERGVLQGNYSDFAVPMPLENGTIGWRVPDENYKDLVWWQFLTRFTTKWIPWAVWMLYGLLALLLVSFVAFCWASALDGRNIYARHRACGSIGNLCRDDTSEEDGGISTGSD